MLDTQCDPGRLSRQISIHADCQARQADHRDRPAARTLEDIGKLNEGEAKAADAK